jgi:hypothetical protein
MCCVACRGEHPRAASAVVIVDRLATAARHQVADDCRCHCCSHDQLGDNRSSTHDISTHCPAQDNIPWHHGSTYGPRQHPQVADGCMHVIATVTTSRATWGTKRHCLRQWPCAPDNAYCQQSPACAVSHAGGSSHVLLRLLVVG